MSSDAERTHCRFASRGKWGSRMQRIDAGYIYELGKTAASLKQFRLQQEVQAYQIWGPLSLVRQKVSEFLSTSIYSASLRTIYPSANAFIAAIDALIAQISQQQLQVLGLAHTTSLFDAYDKFEPVLNSELSAITTYLVQPKGAYDVAVLVEAGERMFPSLLQLRCRRRHSTFSKAVRASPLSFGPLRASISIAPMNRFCVVTSTMWQDKTLDLRTRRWAHYWVS